MEMQEREIQMGESESIYYILQPSSIRRGHFSYIDRIEAEDMKKPDQEGPIIITTSDGDTVPVAADLLFKQHTFVLEDFGSEDRGSRRLVKAHMPNRN